MLTLTCWTAATSRTARSFPLEADSLETGLAMAQAMGADAVVEEDGSVYRYLDGAWETTFDAAAHRAGGDTDGTADWNDKASREAHASRSVLRRVATQKGEPMPTFEPLPCNGCEDGETEAGEDCFCTRCFSSFCTSCMASSTICRGCLTREDVED